MSQGKRLAGVRACDMRDMRPHVAHVARLHPRPRPRFGTSGHGTSTARQGWRNGAPAMPAQRADGLKRAVVITRCDQFTLDFRLLLLADVVPAARAG